MSFGVACVFILVMTLIGGCLGGPIGGFITFLLCFFFTPVRKD